MRDAVQMLADFMTRKLLKARDKDTRKMRSFNCVVRENPRT